MESVSPERITVAIYGLTKDGCATLAVEQALLRLPGVSRAYVNSATEMAYVEYDPARTTHTQLLRAIEGVGLRTGELNIRSVGSALPSPPRRLAVPADTERDTPMILTDPPAVVRPVVSRHAALDAHYSVTRNASDPMPGMSTQARDTRPARYTLGYLRRYLRPRLWGQLFGPRVPRLPLFGGFVSLAVVGALLWLIVAGQGVPENTFNIEVGASGFNPIAIVLPAGKPATLRVRNADLASGHGNGASHQFAISELGINVKLQPGQSTVINLRPLQPATYHYYCDLCCGGSNDPAMQGALIVH